MRVSTPGETKEEEEKEGGEGRGRVSAGEMDKKKVERENKRKGGIGLRMLAGIVLETGSIRKDNKESARTFERATLLSRVLPKRIINDQCTPAYRGGGRR